MSIIHFILILFGMSIPIYNLPFLFVYLALVTGYMISGIRIKKRATHNILPLWIVTITMLLSSKAIFSHYYDWIRWIAHLKSTNSPDYRGLSPMIIGKVYGIFWCVFVCFPMLTVLVSLTAKIFTKRKNMRNIHL